MEFLNSCMLPYMSLIMIPFTANQCNAFISYQVNICWLKILNVSPKIVLSSSAVSHGNDYMYVYIFPTKHMYVCVIITHSLSCHPFYVYIFRTKHVLCVISHILLGCSYYWLYQVKTPIVLCSHKNMPNAPRVKRKGDVS